MESHDAVVIEQVHFVVTRPGTLEPGLLKGRNALSQCWPQHRLERLIVRLERGIVGIGGGWHAGNVTRPFRPDPETRRIDEQRKGLQLRPAPDYIHRTSARRDGQIKPSQSGHRASPWTRRIHHKTAGNPRATTKLNRPDAPGAR